VRGIGALAIVALLGACATTGPRDAGTSAASGKRPGGYYLDDGPEANPPANLDAVPDAQPRAEPIRLQNTRPYQALGRTYVPMTSLQRYSETGIASWYGKRYHGQPTASGETYDMYAMTAAHPTLPIPSYARVTLADGSRSVVVRINDRGPFHADRVIDLSYTAAYKLGILAGGSARVRVESILPGDEDGRAVTAAYAPPPAGARADPAVARRAPATPSPAAAASPASATAGAPTSPAASAAASPGSEAAPVTIPQAPAARVDAGTAAQPALPTRAEPVVPERAAPAPGVYLQLGAFSAPDNADSFLRRMRAELPMLDGVASVIPADGLYKVQAGPYASRSKAQQVAERIERVLDLKPLFLTR
jgi:rare lipoprotein A